MNSSQVQFPSLTAKSSIKIRPKDDYKYLFFFARHFLSQHIWFINLTCYLRNWPLVLYEFLLEVTSKLILQNNKVLTFAQPKFGSMGHFLVGPRTFLLYLRNSRLVLLFFYMKLDENKSSKSDLFLLVQEIIVF